MNQVLYSCSRFLRFLVFSNRTTPSTEQTEDRRKSKLYGLDLAPVNNPIGNRARHNLEPVSLVHSGALKRLPVVPKKPLNSEDDFDPELMQKLKARRRLSEDYRASRVVSDDFEKEVERRKQFFF